MRDRPVGSPIVRLAQVELTEEHTLVASAWEDWKYYNWNVCREWEHLVFNNKPPYTDICKSLTNGFLWVEISAVDASHVSWKLVNYLSGVDIPDIDETIRGSGSDVSLAWRPRTSQQILLEVMVVAAKGSDSTLSWHERTDVPLTEGAVHRVGDDIFSTWWQRDSGDGVTMAGKSVSDLVAPHVPDFEHVVNSTADNLISSVVESDGSLLISVRVRFHRLSGSQIVNSARSVVTGRGDERNSTTRRMNGIDKVSVAFETSGTATGLHVPDTDAFVSAARHQITSVGVELQVHDSARVASDGRKVFALAIYIPEEDLKLSRCSKLNCDLCTPPASFFVSHN